MTTIQVKPNPSIDPRAAKLLKHPVSGGLLDATGAVPDEGRPWLYDGFTCRLLTDGAIVRAEGDAPGFTAWAGEQIAAQKPPQPAADPAAGRPAPAADPAH